MIEILQIGHAGRTSILMDMFRLRMKQRLEQPQLHHFANDLGLEGDALDTPDAVYMLAVNDEGTLVGSWRLNPWASNIWQISRFEVDLDYAASHGELEQIDFIAMELFDALSDIALPLGIKEAFFHYDERFARVLERIQCRPIYTKEASDLYARSAMVGYFEPGPAMQKQLRQHSGFAKPRVDMSSLPVSLRYGEGLRGG